MRKILISLFLASIINAEYIIEEKKNKIELTKKAAENNRDNIEKSWISNFLITNSYTETDLLNSNDISLSLSQDIYVFGGIQNTIKYASKKYLLDSLSIEVLELSYLKKINQLKIDFLLTQLKYKQSLLRINNYDIDLKLKKDLYELGEVDISAINMLLIERQKALALSVTLKNQLVILNKSAESILNISLEELPLSDFELILKEDFIQKNIEYLYAKKEIEISEVEKDLEKSRYLPKLNLNGNVGVKDSSLKTQEGDYYSYGFKLSIPIDVKMNDILEGRRIAVMIKKNSLNDLKIELSSLYDQQIQKINEYIEQIDISIKNISLYEELVFLTKEQFEVQFKTEFDLKSIQNTLEIEVIEKEIWQLEILKKKMELFFELSLVENE